MYVWRDRNRRDKRNLLLYGEAYWGAEKGAQDFHVEERRERLEGELRHVEYYRHKVRQLMNEYLTTKDGGLEVSLVIDQMEQSAAFDYLTDIGSVGSNAHMRDDVMQIFRKFSLADDPEEIDQVGLERLFSDLQLSMTKKQFNAYLKKLQVVSLKTRVHFSEFYDVFIQELVEAVRPRFPWSMMSMRRTSTGIAGDSSLAAKVLRRLKENVAAIVIADHAVHRATEEARDEYRVVRPCSIVCDLCQRAFVLESELAEHRQGANEFHSDWRDRNEHDTARFRVVEAIFVGNQGRKLQANRLIFSKELNSLQSRIDNAGEEPLRPNMADKGGKRYDQQLSGSFVTGFDPKCGVRPTHRKSGLAGQHLAPIRHQSATSALLKHASLSLQEVIHQLLRCKEDGWVDTVSVCSNPAVQEYQRMQQAGHVGHDRAGLFAVVRFEWNGFAKNKVFLVGEFTGWQPEEMVCSAPTNRFAIVKHLCPGRYRYRFVVEGEHCVDRVASLAADPDGPGGLTNEILVTSMPLDPSLPSSSNEGEGGSNPNPTAAAALSPFPLPRMTMTASSSPLDDHGRGVSRSAGPSVEGAIIHMSRADKAALVLNLRSIDLRNQSLNDDGAWALSSYIKKNKVIRSVDLSYNGISDEGIQAISAALPLLRALSVLKLNGNGFAFDGCRYLCKVLSSSSSLTTLELSNNRLGDDGIEMVGSYLRYNEILDQLFVDSCLVGDDGLSCLRDALLVNRTLKHISLAGNKFGLLGITKLCSALELNASLQHLNLSLNDLGPEASCVIGNLFIKNDTISILSINSINMLGSLRSSYGIHGVCNALATNRSLTNLSMANNSINDQVLVELAHSLTRNPVLLKLDLSGNPIANDDWFDCTKTVRTDVVNLEDMPSLQMSLERNRRRVEDRMRYGSTFDESKLVRMLDDEPHGRWTFRRQWQLVATTKAEKKLIRDLYLDEMKRMQAENEHIKARLDEVMLSLQLYLNEQPCAKYLATLIRFISQYLQDLTRFDVSQLSSFRRAARGEMAAASTSSKNHIRQLLVAARQTSSPSGRSTKSSPSLRLRGQGSPSFAANMGSSRSTASSSSSPLRNISSSSVAYDLNADSFLNAHISILNSIFNRLEKYGDRSVGQQSGSVQFRTCVLTHPLNVQQAFQLLALPLPSEEVQAAVDRTIIPSIRRIGIAEFSDYLLTNATRISKQNQLQRMRMLADMTMFHPPIEEAKAIILDQLLFVHYSELRDEYRALPENKPLYECSYCRKRFAKKESFDKHVLKGNLSQEHRRHRIESIVHHSQMLFLQQVKTDFTGVIFPAYYELKPSSSLPRNYFPQVFDKVGSEGRPFGVVEANRAIRALDVFGEYLHVSLHGRLGWIHYRTGSREYLQTLRGFDWNKLRIQEDITYYRVNDLIPPEVELKVRYQPYDSAEVVGYLSRNHVVECMAVMDDWLQVRFEEEEVAWVQWKTSYAAVMVDKNSKDVTTTVPPLLNESSEKISSLGLFTSSLKSTASSWIGLGPQEGGGRQNNEMLKGSSSPTMGAVRVKSPGNYLDKAFSFVKPPRSNLRPVAHRVGVHTPGEQLEQLDDLFLDDLLTYELDGKMHKTNTRKHPKISKAKIELFNRVRYGSSQTGSTIANLLQLPTCCLSIFVVPHTGLPGEQPPKPKSPTSVDQRTLFAHIVALSDEQLVVREAQTPEQERNSLFLFADRGVIGSSSGMGSFSGPGDDDSVGFSASDGGGSVGDFDDMSLQDYDYTRK